MGLWAEYRHQLVADFWRYYGRGFDQLLDGGVPIGDVADMAACLPRESATMQAVAPPQPHEAWGVSDYLLAIAVDLLAAGNWQRGGGRGRRPRPLKRPKLPKQAPQTTVTVDDLMAFRSWYAAQPGGRKLAET